MVWSDQSRLSVRQLGRALGTFDLIGRLGYMTVPIVAIVGRPNVGKSTLFNRLIKRRVAIVHDQPGVTRDRNYFLTSWNRKSFYLVDTGGFVPEATSEIDQLVKEQAEIAVAEADLILFIVDGQVGIQTIDLALARKLKQTTKRVLLVANKVDTEDAELEQHTFLRLGLGEPFSVSALNGRNVAELLDQVADFLQSQTVSRPTENSISVAVLGRPNVGKSSLINALVGKPKLVVSEKPGTTRDAIDTLLIRDGQSYTFIDTAGLQRKTRFKHDLDYFISLRTLRSIERCDVALVMIQADQGLVQQDIRIAEQVAGRYKGLIWVVNKWDLVEKDSKTADQYTKLIHQFAPAFDFAPVIYISAKTRKHLSNILPLIQKVSQECNKRVKTGDLNDIIQSAVRQQPPPAIMGKQIRILYIAQTSVAPPTFVFMTNEPGLIPASYLRYLKNQIRRNFGFVGSPLRIRLKKKTARAIRHL